MFAFHRRCDKMMDLLQDQISDLREHLVASEDELRKLLEIHLSLIEKNRNLEQELKERTISPTTFAPYPLHMSEDEEDAQVAFESGRIDKTLYEDILREIGAENTEIQLDE